ncbi:hypothetical protein COCMIDRAFT_97818, partial [Bipolaris oryzae ATCC 44560]
TVASILPFSPYIGDQTCSSTSSSLLMLIVHCRPFRSRTTASAWGEAQTKILAQACSSGNLLLMCSLTSSHVELISSMVSKWLGRSVSIVSKRKGVSHLLAFMASWKSSCRSVPYNIGALALLVAFTRS